MTGIIKSYSIEKQYGFIKGDDNNDYFFHTKSLKDSQDINKLCNDLILNFEQKVTPKGYSAINITIERGINIGYVAPDNVYTNKEDEVRGWEIIEKSNWRITASSSYSPDDAKELLKSRAKRIGANCILQFEYFKTTGSEAGTGQGTYYYTIHNYIGYAANIAKKIPNGNLKREDLICIDEKAKGLKSKLILKTNKSSNSKMILWAINILLMIVAWTINIIAGGILTVVLTFLGIMFIYSTNYDSWLRRVDS